MLKETANLQIRIPIALKHQADDLFRNLGLDTTTAVRIFLTQSVAQRKIPFQIEEPRDANGFTQGYATKLLKSIAQLDQGLSQEHELIEE